MPSAAPFDPSSLPLHDIHLPPPVSWWPPAPGWWLLLLLVLLLAGCLYCLWRRRQRHHYRRLALHRLQELERHYAEQPDPQRLLQSLSRLLRQMALLHFPQDSCAGLVGDAWLGFLDRQLGGTDFSEGSGRVLAAGPYLPRSSEFEAGVLCELCRRWLRRLPPAPQPGRGRR